MVRKNYGTRHGSCGLERLHSHMDTATQAVENADLDLDLEIETWDWARAAGVSADDLRLALQASLPAPELLKAA